MPRAFLPPARALAMLAIGGLILVGCTQAATPTGGLPSPTSTSTAATSAVPSAVSTGTAAAPTQSAAPSSTLPPTASAQPQTPTPGASASPSAAAGDDLAALFGSLAPALAPFSAGPLSVRSAEDIISQLEEFVDFPGVQDEIDRYIEGGLVERGSISLGTTPAASISIDRFESEEGAAADFPLRQPSCDELPLPGTALANVVVKRCNAPNANDLYVMAHRGDRVVTLQVLELPDDQAIEPVVAMLTDMFRAIDPLLTL